MLRLERCVLSASIRSSSASLSSALSLRLRPPLVAPEEAVEEVDGTLGAGVAVLGSEEAAVASLGGAGGVGCGWEAGGGAAVDDDDDDGGGGGAWEGSGSDLSGSAPPPPLLGSDLAETVVE